MLKRIVACVREYKAATFLTILFIVGEAVIEAFIPFITADLVNEISLGDIKLESILMSGLLLVLMAVASLACGGIAGYTCAKASAGFAKNLRHDMFRKIQTFSFSNIDKFSSSSLVTRMTTDINNVQMAYMMIIRMAIRAPLMTIFCIIMAFVMGGELAYTFLFVVPFLAIGLIVIACNAMPTFRRIFKKYDKLNESIEENVAGMRVVKGYAREPYEKKKFEKASGEIRKDFTRAERIVAMNGPLMQLCIYFNMVFVLSLGSYLVISNSGSTIGIGQVSAMLTYGVQILMQLMMLSMLFVMLTMSAEAAKRIDEVLTEEPSITNPENAVTEIKDGSVDFENVSFKYSEKASRYSLSDVTLHIPSGYTVGILGGTGSGKSSLVQLIPRLYDISEGTLKVGGVDVRNYDLTALRDNVAMVLQKNILFSGTIKDNLRWGNENATDDEMIEACKLAQADEFIGSFPDGYDTMIDQGGTNLSGGQKQRLCIARALLKKPKILILDDSTSAVDTKTDALIRSGFKKFIPETTKFIIAQRVASVQDADMIIIMDNGAVSACGTHEELLKTSEIYRDIYEQQASTGGDENAPKSS